MIQNSQNRDLKESQALTISYTEYLSSFEIHNFLNLLVSLVFSCPVPKIRAGGSTFW